METNNIKHPTEKLSFREKANRILTSPFFIFEVIVISTFLMIWAGNSGYFLGVGAALITLWSSKWNWSFFGMGKIKVAQSFRLAFAYFFIILIVNDLFLEPIVEIITNTPVDLSNFEGLKGNLTNIIIMLLIMWIAAAFGEEFFYRGYIMNRIAHLLGNNSIAWIAAAIISSILFGAVHSYQGVSGIITTGTVGLILALAFYQNRNNLLVGILTHGIYDTYGLLLIYFDKNLVVKNFMIEFYQTIIN